MLHLGTEIYNNEQISKVLGRILAETCLKMDYFGSMRKSKKIAKRRKLYPQALLPPADWGFAPRPPFRLND